MATDDRCAEITIALMLRVALALALAPSLVACPGSDDQTTTSGETTGSTPVNCEKISAQDECIANEEAGCTWCVLGDFAGCTLPPCG